MRGDIRLENVSFEYPRSRSHPGHGDKEAQAPFIVAGRALENVSFEVRAGERVALVGPSGAGKTTITYFLPWFYDPTEGRIILDGHDLRDVTQDSLRAHIGAVTQDTFLFHTSVRENLLYAKPDATQDEMFAAARSANIHDFIVGLRDGYDTVVGERGFRLSGGEKQRLAIARAMLRAQSISYTSGRQNPAGVTCHQGSRRVGNRRCSGVSRIRHVRPPQDRDFTPSPRTTWGSRGCGCPGQA